MLSSERAVTLLKKATPDRLSKQMIGSQLTLMCQICDHVDLSEQANVLCAVRQGAVFRVNVATGA